MVDWSTLFVSCENQSVNSIARFRPILRSTAEFRRDAVVLDRKENHRQSSVMDGGREDGRMGASIARGEAHNPAEDRIG